MWRIAGHELVTTGSHYDSEYWGYIFVVRCFACPGQDIGEDIPLYVGSEAQDPADYEIDYRAMLTAVADHLGDASGLQTQDIEGAVLVAALENHWEPGLDVLQERSNEYWKR